MRGQVVLLRMENQYTLAAISVQHNDDIADLRALAMYADGSVGMVEIQLAQRGTGVGEWSDTMWPIPAPVAPPTPMLSAVQPELMPAVALPPMAPMPLMV